MKTNGPNFEIVEKLATLSRDKNNWKEESDKKQAACLLFCGRIVSESGVRDGICMVFIPHTTAAVTINENADPDVVRDHYFLCGAGILTASVRSALSAGETRPTRGTIREKNRCFVIER